MEHLVVEPRGHALMVTFNRPEVRNALSLAMVDELEQVFASGLGDARCVVLRGAGGHFCAGGDVSDMVKARAEGEAGIARTNRRFGTLVEKVTSSPVVVVAAAEGAVLGGGFGLLCAADIAVGTPDAKFGMPEVTLGLLPAQIAPFVAARIGVSKAKHLALTGARFDGQRAYELGLLHEVGDVDVLLERVLKSIKKAGPRALTATKALLSDDGALDARLDRAAAAFAQAASSEEGVEGMSAFVEKRSPSWASEDV